MSTIVSLFQTAFLGTPWTLFEVSMIFLFYSVLGWCVEICYMTVQMGEVQNRGFLNGPLCPIYGFGVLSVILVLTPLQGNIFLLFIGSTIVCTVVELLVGIGMEKIFHNIWWDYSMEKYNYKGYICLKISILWGLACVAMMRLLQPLLMRIVRFIPQKIGVIFVLTCFLLLLFDFIVAICVVKKLNTRLKQLDDITDKLRFAADNIGGVLGTEALELKARYDSLVEKKNFAQERLLKAFPTMHSHRYASSLEQLKVKILKQKNTELPPCLDSKMTIDDEKEKK